MKAYWLIPNRDPRRASLRYRCLYPMRELTRSGYSVGFLESDAIGPVDTVAIDAWTLFPTISDERTADSIVTRVRRLQQAGVRIILDNCDNQFANENAQAAWSRALDRLKEVGRLADQVVVCSDALGDAMRTHLGTSSKLRIIDDPVEDHIRYPDDSIAKSILSPSRKRSWWNYTRHRLTIRADKRAGRTPLVWFGSHGNQFAPGGMLDLLSLRATLEAVDSHSPLSLTLISNNHNKFLQNFSDWSFPVRYLAWDRITFLALLRLHHIALIPAQLNDFTRCKSTNRLTLALYHGLGVIADPIPSYSAYAPFVRIGNWQENLLHYIASPDSLRRDIAQGQRLAQIRNNIAAISTLWRDVLFSPNHR